MCQNTTVCNWHHQDFYALNTAWMSGPFTAHGGGFHLEPIEESYFGEVAKRYRYIDSDIEVDVISSVSESFCSTCTRARISADSSSIHAYLLQALI